ncbi:MAG: hypothetical protein PHG23_02795 [Candidatus Pacebacteria bacterium]|nr:hypothetical protein [Candidatus Paceibacterota bacterium]
MHRTKLAMLLLIVALLSCVTNPSSLSDIILSDPSVVNVSAKIIYNANGDSSYDSVFVSLADKYGSSVVLKNGGCFINDIQMKIFSHTIDGGLLLQDYTAYYYLGNNDIKIKPCSSYALTILLGDSTRHKSVISAPPIINYNFAIPANFNWGDPIVLTWDTLNSNDSAADVKLYFLDRYVALFNSDLLKCRYTIPNEFIANYSRKPDTLLSTLKIIKLGIKLNEFSSFNYQGVFSYNATH